MSSAGPSYVVAGKCEPSTRATIRPGIGAGVPRQGGENAIPQRYWRTRTGIALAAVILLSCLAATQPARAGSLPVGTAPAGMALNPSTGVLYVANPGDGTVSAVATATSSLLATIPLTGTVSLGGSPAPTGVGVDVQSNLVFVAETGARKVALIDGASKTLRSTVAVDIGPWGVVVNQTTNTVFVSALGGSVTVLDGLTGTVKSVVRDSRLQRPLGLAVNETINRVYVASRDGNSVVVLDGGANTVTAVIPVGTRPAAVAVDPTSGAVYAANSGANTLSRIDAGTNSVTATLNAGTGLTAVAVDPATGIVYAGAGDNTITVLDGSGGLLGTLTDPSLNGPQALLVNATAGQLYVSNGVGATVTTLPLSAIPGAAGPAPPVSEPTS
jgi:YVTN family beta-propeller protein